MQYTTLGRTGLKVSVAGLGCGGNSRIGLGAGRSMEEAATVIRAAIDHGVTYIDTARNYGTEPAVGMALKGVPRDSVVISTKAIIREKGERIAPAELVARLDHSLTQLGTDYTDIYFLHGVALRDYEYARDVLAPAMLKERDKGKFRHLGITEPASSDPEQASMRRAVDDPDAWEVMMLAFHMMHQTARSHIFPKTQAGGVGTAMMYVVRNVFSRPGLLEETVRDLIERGALPADALDPADPLGFLVHEDGAESVIDAAYRFARHQPGADTVLFGTGNVDHLKANIESILRPPLPEADVARLHELFGTLTGVGLDLPDHMRG
ncbi:MAG: aldo/keto reductase [Alphaproteobacteria bacterium]|nr:aldo/keto reductase [Alphaproteobacteria bacterium]